MTHASARLIRHLRQLVTQPSEALPDRELLRRFVTSRDENAFATLVERHAAMVMGLCRSILHNSHDAEDIFQAAFLVLARKAGSIRKAESVGSWLHAVAYRMAQRACVRIGKRREQELPAALLPGPTPMDEVAWGELRGILHEEVNRLPEKYRAAIVLCYWQGQTHEEAGQQLGCARGTVKDRLERAREMLRTRLARRGLALSAAWLAASLSGEMASAELVRMTVRGAMLFSMGELPTGVVSAHAVRCAKGVLQGMFLGKLKLGAMLVLMLGVLGGGAGLAILRESPTPAAPAEQPKAASPKQEREQADPLPPGAIARLGTLHFRHGDAITHIAIGADGTSILSATSKAVYVWDLATGKERRRFQGHKAALTSFACSRDGKLLGSGCQDGTIHLWDAATGRELHHFTAHKGRAPDWVGPSGAFVTAFTPDGRQLVSMGSENTIRLWNAASGEQIHEFGRFSAVGSVSLSPDGKTLAGVVKDDKAWEIRLWEVATGRERKRQTLPGKRILSVAFSPDGKMLVVGVGEGDWNKPCDLQLWDASATKEIRTLRGHKGWAWCAFAPDSKTLASWSNASVDATIRLWDLRTGKEIRRLGAGKTFLTQLLFCLDGRTLVSYTQGNHFLRFWDRASGKEVRSSGDAISPIHCLSFSPDGRWLAAGSKSDWVIRLWDVAARKKVHRFEHDLLTAVRFSPDGSRLASTAWTDAHLRIWEVASGKELRRIPTDKGARSIDCMTWSGDGKVLATWSYGNPIRHPIRLWNPDTGKQVRELSASMDQIEALVFSPDSKVVAALGSERRSSWQTRIILWAADTGQLLHSLEAPIGPANVGFDAHARLDFSPDGRTLAAGGQGAESSIYLWEVVSGRRRLTLKHGEDVASLAFSPDGKLLATANNINNVNNLIAQGRVVLQDGAKPEPPRVRLWDMVAEKELPSLQGHKGSITSLSFSPDGKLLATGSNDTTILLWDAMRFQPRQPAQVQLRTEQIESLWTDLDGADAVKAYRAIRTLAAASRQSVDFLKRHLHPVAPADSKQVARLLADLDNEQFAAREKAMRELEKLGERAATDLHKALSGKPSLEVRRRIEQLLERNGKEQVRMTRALEALERMGTPEARELCALLARGVAEARLTRAAQATLRRLSR
jgi:RNA polymerase sigma factor (sigma-70 family)